MRPDALDNFNTYRYKNLYKDDLDKICKLTKLLDVICEHIHVFEEALKSDKDVRRNVMYITGSLDKKHFKDFFEKQEEQNRKAFLTYLKKRRDDGIKYLQENYNYAYGEDNPDTPDTEEDLI